MIAGKLSGFFLGYRHIPRGRKEESDLHRSGQAGQLSSANLADKIKTRSLLFVLRTSLRTSIHSFLADSGREQLHRRDIYR